MQTLLDTIQGDLGDALAALGIPVIIWGIVLFAIGFIQVHKEYKIKGTLLFVAGALLAGLKSFMAAIF